MPEMSERLAHVYWIGGTGGAGESALSARPAGGHGRPWAGVLPGCGMPWSTSKLPWQAGVGCC